MEQTPIKYLIKDLLNKLPATSVWLQGTIEQSVGNDILIISDNTGKAKITKLLTADGVIDKKSLSKGIYCCILGTLVKTKGLPEIQAIKFIDLNNQPQMKIAWEAEVNDANLFLEGRMIPQIH